MSYQLGIDVGTTYSAAAVHRDGRADIATLGGRAPSIPSVVLLREDGTFLTGDAAERRAVTEPERVVREFKRRLGDSTPIIVAGSPYSAESLTSRLLGAIVEKVVETEGSQPEKIVVTRPANWGDFKVDLLRQAAGLAGIDPDVISFITEPEAAAISYAVQERVEPGEIIAVYDLGGGTFDAAVLRRTVASFEIIGRPEGIERLGGIDFDAAVFAHVAGNLGDTLTEIDPNDPAAVAAVARLRRDCVEAKEALSSDTDAVIPVMIPRRQTEVRITRSEFEGIIRPSLMDTVGAMERAVASADIEIADVTRILLVGGSSRIPLVAQLVASQLARPVAVDTHPKHTVAVGAAFAAGGVLEELEALDGAGPAQAPADQTPKPAPSVAKPEDLGKPGGAHISVGFQAGQTRLSEKPLPGPQLFHTPDTTPPAGTPPAVDQPAAKTPPGADRPGGRSPGPAKASPRRPKKARPVTSPGHAPPQSSRPPGQARPGAQHPVDRPGAAARAVQQRAAPPKAKPVAFPGEAPPKARPVNAPGTPPPRANPPSGATKRPVVTPPSGAAKPPVVTPPSGAAKPPVVTPPSGAARPPVVTPAQGGPNDATVVFGGTAPPGLGPVGVSGSTGGGGPSALVWLLIAVVVVGVLVGGIVLLT